MLTAKAVARQLGLTEQQVYGIDLALLPRYQFGRAIRYKEADLEAYRASLPRFRKPPRARELRECARLMARAGNAPTLSPEQQAIVDLRMRRMRMPPWASGKAVRAIYAEAARLTRETAVPHHVDHVIPLQGDYVSGLHVETNLQILPALDNIRKRNRFDEPC